MRKILQVKKLSSVIDISLGLISAKKPHAIYFQTRFGIHTFFMKFAIDVLILDEENQVVRLKQNLQPNNIFLWSLQFDKVIELPSGDIKKNKIKAGDAIELKFV